MINELDLVTLSTDLPEHGLSQGASGTVVHVYKDGQAYDVEFLNPEGRTVAVATLELDQVQPWDPHQGTVPLGRSIRFHA